jgi:RNA-directed DNA polymerase
VKYQAPFCKIVCGVISPLLSNIYLDPLDHLMAAAGFEMVRYADDFVILCRTAQDADAALALVREWTAQAGLTLHPEKTHVAHAESEGFEFLGYHFTRGERFPRAKSLKKLKAAIRDKTRRKQRHGIECTIQEVNTTLVGWFGYFKHVTKRYVFEDLDRFVRQRLRAILKKQQKRPGIPKGQDFKRWPNAFFGNRKLFSLKAAHKLACQSSTR